MRNIKENIGLRIKELRLTNSNSNLEDFATKIGMDVGYLSRVENGKQNITIETLNTICDALGVSLSIFFKPFE